MVRFPKTLTGFTSPLRAERPRPRRTPAFAVDALERKLSPSAYTMTMLAQDPLPPKEPEPTDLPPGYPLPFPPKYPGGPNGPA